jgi:hypothetical protein
MECTVKRRLRQPLGRSVAVKSRSRAAVHQVQDLTTAIRTAATSIMPPTDRPIPRIHVDRWPLRLPGIYTSLTDVTRANSEIVVQMFGYPAVE